MIMNTLQELKRSLKKDLSSLPSINIALAGDTATQLLATAIRGTGVLRGYNIDLFEAEYNQVEQQMLIPTSELHQFDADFIVVFQSTHKLGEKHSLLTTEQQMALADERLQFIADICNDPVNDGKSFKTSLDAIRCLLLIPTLVQRWLSVWMYSHM